MALLMCGKIAAEQFRERLKHRLADLGIRGASLVVVTVGDDPASQVYVRNKTIACEEIGISGKQINLPATITQEELLEQIRSLANNPDVDGILVQLPLPAHLNKREIICAIPSHRDMAIKKKECGSCILAMAILMSGKIVAEQFRERLKHRLADLGTRGASLVVVLVGDDPASQVYVRNKTIACEKIGIRGKQINLPATITQEELLEQIRSLANNPDVDGILVQLPLPAHLNEKEIISEIPPHKDVDAFSTENVGAVSLGDYGFVPCTPAGIIELLDYYNIPIEGRYCTIVGRSNIVGKPLSMLMLKRNATVTVCHSKTENLEYFTKSADILVSAVGMAGLVTADMVKEGAVVVDVGMNRRADGKLCGDVDFESVEKVASYITPVPGGVGPMTIAMLMQNTIKAAELAAGR